MNKAKTIIIFERHGQFMLLLLKRVKTCIVVTVNKYLPKRGLFYGIFAAL